MSVLESFENEIIVDDSIIKNYYSDEDYKNFRTQTYAPVAVVQLERPFMNCFFSARLSKHSNKVENSLENRVLTTNVSTASQQLRESSISVSVVL